MNETEIFIIVTSILLIILLLIIYLFRNKLAILFGFEKPPIKVGILHSLTGTMALSATAVADATLMAINEINESGGLLGRKIQPILVDGRSDWQCFRKMSKQLITKDKVCVVFGCWASSNRKSIKPIFEEYNHLLIYPIQYEGLEDSPNIIYTGAAPNQQVIPTIKWTFDNVGKRFYLVGSDYVFSHTTNTIIKEQLKLLGGEVIGEDYITLGSKNVKNIVDKIKAKKPEVIINSINGDSIVHFFKELRAQSITPKNIPTVSFSIGEDTLRYLNTQQMAGDYAAWNYFQNISSEINQEFVKNYKEKYGMDRVTDDPIESGYFGVYLWAQAVLDAGTEDVNKVREAIKGQHFMAPEGVVYVDPENNHTWKIARIGKIREDGQFDIIWSSMKPITPIPYPAYRSKAQWESFLQELYEGWGNRWVNDPTKKD